ncbi:hypothetical protein SAMN03080615_03165 [Amphritea atlantica]|uniref:Uncharacterized protein n=1 Tax=Amphritea atlantica TaxID=355243 RepID=A0A1H9JTR5_9GAMM|nr:hypothetical protein SAMN03080615_03165 [Amphritea atlantica]
MFAKGVRKGAIRDACRQTGVALLQVSGSSVADREVLPFSGSQGRAVNNIRPADRTKSRQS